MHSPMIQTQFSDSRGIGKDPPRPPSLMEARCLSNSGIGNGIYVHREKHRRALALPGSLCRERGNTSVLQEQLCRRDSSGLQSQICSRLVNERSKGLGRGVRQGERV